MWPKDQENQFPDQKTSWRGEKWSPRIKAGLQGELVVSTLKESQWCGGRPANVAQRPRKPVSGPENRLAGRKVVSKDKSWFPGVIGGLHTESKPVVWWETSKCGPKTKKTSFPTRKSTSGKKSGLPSLIAFPSGCNTANCLIRYEGELSVDAVTNWFATTILSLPCILYYSKDSLLQSFVGKSSPHKFWITGESHFLLRNRGACSSIRASSCPKLLAICCFRICAMARRGIFLLVECLGQCGAVTTGRQLHDLDDPEVLASNPQSSNDPKWECLGPAPNLGSQGGECMGEPMAHPEQLSKHRIQEALSTVDNDQLSSLAAVALKEKRLTFTWLDGEAQQT
ncbi:hypothetical protein HYC85_029898 [Camellia sinensis]|uniref:Uncharacterized protein n=1 Tax=Camellia sinensis TaxID=4442 RepID=A0A7J7FZV7_CAMSI|nr:hypothetical protein HYC85_029898 [Camellia sinensis]